MRKKVLGLTVALAIVASVGFAAKSPKVLLETKQLKETKVINKRGQIVKILKDIKKVVPGDTVIYQNIVSNFEDKPLKKLVLNNKIPEHTKYVKNSAKCSVKCDVLLSNDGGRTFTKASQLKNKKPVTNVRWILLASVETNKKAVVSYATKIQ